MYLFLHFIFENTTNSSCCIKHSRLLDLPAVGSLKHWKVGSDSTFLHTPCVSDGSHISAWLANRIFQLNDLLCNRLTSLGSKVHATVHLIFMHHYCKFRKLGIYLNTWQTDTQRSHLNISALWWMWSRPTFCALCQTSCSNNPQHCSSSLQSWDRTQCFVFNPPWSLQSCSNRIWIWMLCLASWAAQTQPFSGHLCCKHSLCGVPSLSLHSPSWQWLLLSRLIAIQMGMCCLVKEMPLSGSNLLQGLQSTLCLCTSQV